MRGGCGVFTRYNPWDERVCATPDGDFLVAVAKGRVTMVTDTIDKFVANGIVTTGSPDTVHAYAPHITPIMHYACRTCSFHTHACVADTTLPPRVLCRHLYPCLHPAT